MDLESLRKQIDAIDEALIERLNARVQLGSEIGRIKQASGQEIVVPSREEEVFQRLIALNQGPLTGKAIRAIFREIISATIALQKRVVVAYLGPEATYTHQAALKGFGSSAETLPLGTIADVFSLVQRGRVDYGVIPVENSTEGAVFHSLDLLVETDLKIVAQIYLKISHCLIALSPLEKIEMVHSKDNALGQCRQWLSRMLPQAKQVEMASTAKAVQFAKEHPEAAAVGSKIAAEIYGVPVVAEDIQDKTDNTTRFLVIGQSPSAHRGEETSFKTSLVFSLKDEPGALQRALETFGKRGINLCKIESRPSRRKLWDYYFFIDLIGHHDDPSVKEAVKELRQSSSMVKWLGSYPNPSA